jgi:uncharacterized protein
MLTAMKLLSQEHNFSPELSGDSRLTPYYGAGSVFVPKTSVSVSGNLKMFFNTAGIEVAPWVPPLVALVISFFTSMGGVSGAFLLLPFQMSVLGYNSPSVSATNQLYNVVATPAGICRYLREGRMVWPLCWAVVIGTLPGVLIGAVIRITLLPDPSSFKLFAALVLLYIGWRLVRDLLSHAGREPINASADKKAPSRTRVLRFSISVIEYEFGGEIFSVSTPAVFGLSFLVGIAGGAYGIGGGAIMAPILITFFRLPVHTIAGAALMGTFVTSVAAVIFFSCLAPFFPGTAVAPDLALGALFGLGGLAGIYLGARCQKFVPSRYIKWMLLVVIVFVAGKYIWAFVKA